MSTAPIGVSVPDSETLSSEKSKKFTVSFLSRQVWPYCLVLKSTIVAQFNGCLSSFNCRMSVSFCTNLNTNPVDLVSSAEQW